MFWKLCKFEYRSNYRTYMMMYAVLIVCSMLLSLGRLEYFTQMALMNMAFSLIMVIYVGAIMAVWILCLVNIIRGYHNSMYKRQSYLTHTLPVATWQLLLVKLLFSIIWLSLTMIVVIASIIFMMLNLSNLNLSMVIDTVLNIDWSRMDFTFVILYSLQLLVQVIQGIMFLYFVISFVNSSYVQRYRIPIAFAIILLFSWMQNYFLFTFGDVSYTAVFEVSWVDITINLAIFVATYIGSVFLIDRKMEVE